MDESGKGGGSAWDFDCVIFLWVNCQKSITLNTLNTCNYCLMSTPQ